MQSKHINLGNLSLNEWGAVFSELGLSTESQQKVYEAIFYRGINRPEETPGLTEAESGILSKNTAVHKAHREQVFRSKDGSIKLTFRLHDGNYIETVIIPEWEGEVLRKCSASISSQVGCFFGCSFCATGQMGFVRNVTTGEFLDQVREAGQLTRSELGTGLTHLYFMGMGEPLHNYRALSDVLTIMRNYQAPGPPADRITVSTVGLYRQIRMLTIDHPEVRLAVSIHSADQKTRCRIMPVSARLGLPEIRNALLYHTRQTGRPVTIQYLLLDGINDHRQDAEQLAAWLNGVPAIVTLIMYNQINASPLHRTESLKLFDFRNFLTDFNISTDIRWCYGEDIEAGCGQLQPVSGDERKKYSIRHDSQAVEPPEKHSRNGSA
ncbi:MAG: 23S rRNA (adenine(2503)-C(2))-methyltransferase RlmN [Balneolales bacterium]